MGQAPPNLTSPEMEAAIAAKVAEFKQLDGPAKRAAATALPGPLADAFALNPNIQVGPYSIRPFFDIDFEFLALLKHPLDEQFKDVMEGKEFVNRFLPRGLPAWQAFWIMTHTVDETEALLMQPNGEGIAELNFLAKKEFSRLPTKALSLLFEAVMKQVTISSSTAVEYGPAKEGEGSVVENPPLPLHQATG